MRRAARTDANHAAIVAALRRMGVTVVSLAAVGHGVPDLLCAARGRTWLIEVKDGSLPPSARALTLDQVAFHKRWPGTIYILESVDRVPSLVIDALR